MSSKGIYTALSGAIAQTERLETIANNIANANTTAFKQDGQTFYEYLTANEKDSNLVRTPRVPSSIPSFYDMQGGDRGFVDSSGTYTNFEQGSIKETGNPFDVAIEGKGFLEVQTAQGIRYTKNGRLKLSSSGELVTSLGHPVLNDQRDLPVEQRKIRIQGSTLSIGRDGSITTDNKKVGRLSLVEIEPLDGLKKIGSQYYEIKSVDPIVVKETKESQVVQGHIEGSNINIIQEMTDMIQTTRNFEATQKAIKAYDQMSGKLVNDVPKTY